MKVLGLISLFLIIILLFVGQRFLKQKSNIISPLPDFLMFSNNNQIASLELWVPSSIHAENKNHDVDKPEITAKSALVYDLISNKILFEKNPDDKLPMASLTKIITAVIALENYKKNDKFKVKKADLVGENSMGLSNGEILTLEELLYGLVLPSGNDAAEVLANNYSGGRFAFIKAMNNKAKSLGVLNTNFTNPSGLEGDGLQYTTVYDLLIITRHALGLPLFKKIVSTFEYGIEQTDDHKGFYLQNETNLLTSYPGVLGVKTGYTPEAGFCLVTYLEYEDHEIIGIILGSEKRREEMRQLLDYSLKIQEIDPPYHD